MPICATCRAITRGWSGVVVGFDSFGSEQGFHVHFDAFFWPLGGDVSIGVGWVEVFGVEFHVTKELFLLHLTRPDRVGKPQLLWQLALREMAQRSIDLLAEPGGIAALRAQTESGVMLTTITSGAPKMNIPFQWARTSATDSPISSSS